MILNGIPSEIPEIRNPVAVKILCAYKAYANQPSIAQFWHQIDNNGNMLSLICSLNGYLNLWSNNSDTDEIASFIKFLSPVGIFTNLDTANKLRLRINEKCLCFEKLPPFEKTEYVENGTPRELLRVLRCGLEIPDADSFIADVSFRKYHDAAEYVINGGGALIYFNDQSALIHGIAVPKAERKKGVGSFLIKLILSKAESRKVYACCIKENENFYIKNGFTYIGEAAYCEEK